MAGSGKTTFVQRLTSHLYSRKTPPYVLNLDPACREVPYPANIDIRDTVNYKQVMKQYQLGPNGGIVTSLNLFATKFDQVLELVSFREHYHRGPCRPVPHRRRLRDGLCQIDLAGYFHVQHALRLLHPLQMQAALRHRHEQN